MQDSARYFDQAEAIRRLAIKADSEAERRIYDTIAEGWRKLGLEARRSELRAAIEPRSFKPPPI